MSERTAVTEEEAYELLAHLVASAELCIREPYYYGTFRLIDAASKLIGFMLQHSSSDDSVWLEAFKDEVDTKKEWMMWDRDGYFAFLRGATGSVAEQLKRRQTAVSRVIGPDSGGEADGNV